MDAFSAFHREAAALLAEAARGLGSAGPLPALEAPPDPQMGDLGLPCFALAKALRKPPAAIAAALAQAVRVPPGGWVESAAAAGPYVNLRIARARVAAEVLRDPEAAFRGVARGAKVLLEHTSANPNGPLHVGRARNPIVGDTLARLYRVAGYDVETQYYMDNLGRQVATLAWGKWNIQESELEPVQYGTSLPAKVDHDLVRYYQAAHDRAKTDPQVAAQIKALVERLESADPALLAKVRTVYEACFEGMKESLERLNVRHDTLKDESDVVQDGSVERTIAALKRLPIAGVEPDGANYLDLSSLLKGQKDKFYFTRKDGTSVYATRDIAYHAWKADHIRDGDLLNVLGEDHRLQSLQVGAALEALGMKRPTVVFYSFVSLPEGKMSTRANRVVFLDQLLDTARHQAMTVLQEKRPDIKDDQRLWEIAEAVGIAAVRFNIARIQPEKPIEFRWEEALNFEGDSAPYLLYAHARAASLLREAAKAGLSTRGAASPGPGEMRLLAVAARLPAAAAEAVDQNGPHRFCSFALELAAAFNEYYRDHRVLECEDAAQQALRLATVQAARAALRKALEALGLPALDSM